MFSSYSPKQEAPAALQSAEDRFSLVELRKIYKRLVENKIVSETNADLVIEILRVIAEMVVYGDNKSELLFDFFCEKSMLSLFLQIMYSELCPNTVHVQILQTLSILISCVKNDTSLYYLLSNNHINDILVFNHDFGMDESLCAHFASFMKTLSLRLNDQTVQFFFREDSGAFPLLIKAVELLVSKDPMIRISAQSTILNIYRVKEPRATRYAVQEEVMLILFEAVVLIMKDQLRSLEQNAVAFVQASADDATALDKIEQSFDDTVIAIEDWLFYLQDLHELGISPLQHALTSYLLQHFIFPVLLGKLLEVMRFLKPDGQLSSFEIDEELSEGLSKATRASISTLDEEVVTTTAVAEAECALFYLLQIMRIMTWPRLARAFLLGISNSLSEDSRCLLLHYLSSSTSTATSAAISSSKGMGMVEGMKLSPNIFRTGMQQALCLPPQEGESQPPKLATLLVYSVFAAIQTAVKDIVNQVDGAGDYLQYIGFLSPAEADVSTSNDNCYQQSTIQDKEETKESTSSSFNSEQISPYDLQQLYFFLCQRYNNNKNGNKRAKSVADGVGSNNEGLIHFVIQLLQYPQNHALAAIQAAAMVVAVTAVGCCSTTSNSNIISSEPLVDDAIPPIEAADEENNDQSITDKADEEISREEGEGEITAVEDVIVAVNEKVDIPITINPGNTATLTRLWLLTSQAQEALRYAAIVLLSRAETHLAEVLLALVNEEVDRYRLDDHQSRRWSEQQSKIFAEKALAFPVIFGQMDRLGLDHMLPVSQVETLRKEVQTFLVLRALLLYLSSLLVKVEQGNFSAENADFELGDYIKDEALFRLSEETALNKQSQPGAFDMKGRKFLDVIVVSSAAPLTFSSEGQQQQSQPNKINTNPPSSSSSSSYSSMFSMNLFSSSSNNNSPHSNGKARHVSQRQTGSDRTIPKQNGKSTVPSPGQKLLFVQDPILLLLVLSSRVDGKSVFRSHVAAPLIYAEAKVDSTDKKKLRLVVRSWAGIQYMRRLEPDRDGGAVSGENSPIRSNKSVSSNHYQRPFAIYLKQARKSAMYEIELQMDTEQAAALAVQHVETRRKALSCAKMDEIRSVFAFWAAEHRNLLEDVEPLG